MSIYILMNQQYYFDTDINATINVNSVYETFQWLQLMN